jgi:hypothetical protein
MRKFGAGNPHSFVPVTFFSIDYSSYPQKRAKHVCFVARIQNNVANESSKMTNFITRAVSKVRGLTLLLRVGILWRCGDGLFFKVPPLASDALLKTLHPLLGNVLHTVDHFEISCLKAHFSWLEKPRNLMG